MKNATTKNAKQEIEIMIEKQQDIIIGDCVKAITRSKEGYVFNYKQARDVDLIMAAYGIDTTTKEDEGIYYIKAKRAIK